MAVTAARLLVQPPVRTPLPYGLLSAAQLTDEPDAHWANGIRFQPDPCQEAGVTTEPCPVVTGGPAKPATAEGLDVRGAVPFTVYSWVDCSTVGFIDDAVRRATGQLTAGEARAVEREFETGAHGVTPHLAADVEIVGVDGVIEQTAAEVITGSPLDVVEAVGLLERNLGECYGNEGVIHVPSGALAHLAHTGLLRYDGPRLRSPAGHLIAAGSGYIGTSPAGAEPANGEAWFYATGAVSVRRSGINSLTPMRSQVVDRSVNSVVQVVERTYVIGWDCCHFAVLATLGGYRDGLVGSPF